MRRHHKQKPLPIIQNVYISDAAAEGKAVAKIDDFVIFVEGGVPGDVADLQLTKKKKSFGEAKIVNLITPSPQRIAAFCKHFGLCGGCKWQNLKYSQQLIYKQQEVKNNFERLGKFPFPEIMPIIGSEEQQYYRNKLEFTFSAMRWFDDADLIAKKGGKEFSEAEQKGLGFHIPGKFDKVFNVEKCYLQNDLSNSIRDFIKEFSFTNNLPFYDIRKQEGFLRTLIIRNTSLGEWMVIPTMAGELGEKGLAMMEALKNNFPQITSLQYVINTKRNDTISDQDVILYSGVPYITEQMGELKFKIGPKSFFQTNTAQAINLYNVTKDFAGLTGGELVYDLYTGTGTIANYVAKNAKHVVGVEYVADAIVDAKQNSIDNNISNTSFFAGDMKDVLNTEFIAVHGKPDVVITDPPRAGMHADVVNKLLEIAAPKVVYVSCNSATQARDIALMSEMYAVIRVQPVDMFPHTHHVENVVLMELKKEF